MSNLGYIKSLAILAFTFCIACSDKNDDKIEFDKLELTVNSNTIKADGVDQARFTVLSDGKDVTSLVTITAESVTAQNGIFTTSNEGIYTFKATHNATESNYVSVLATNGEGLLLIPSKSTFFANGKDEVIFTVTCLGEDVTAKAAVCSSSAGICLVAVDGLYRFSTTKPGEHAFYGEYMGIKTKDVAVEALESDDE